MVSGGWKMRNFDLSQIGWFNFWSWSKSKGESESGIHVSVPYHIRVELKDHRAWPILGHKKSCPNRMFYISRWPEFQGGSEYQIRNLKFSLGQHIWLYLYNVFQPHYGKIGSWPIRMIYISFLLNFQGDSESELRNLKFCQWQHIWLYCVIAPFGQNTIFINQDVLYIILTRISRGFWISSQKF
jgi:hypothetical protein